MAFDEGEGDRILRAGSPNITDLDAAFAELNFLSRRIGWYAMYTACVRYVKEHLVVPSDSEAALYFHAYLTLKRSHEAYEELKAKEFVETMRILRNGKVD